MEHMHNPTSRRHYPEAKYLSTLGWDTLWNPTTKKGCPLYQTFRRRGKTPYNLLLFMERDQHQMWCLRPSISNEVWAINTQGNKLNLSLYPVLGLFYLYKVDFRRSLHKDLDPPGGHTSGQFYGPKGGDRQGEIRRFSSLPYHGMCGVRPISYAATKIWQCENAEVDKIDRALIHSMEGLALIILEWR